MLIYPKYKDTQTYFISSPSIKIGTKEAFGHLKNHLLNENMDINLSQLLKELNNYSFNSKLFKNDFEMYVFETHPEIGAIKLKILDFGANMPVCRVRVRLCLEYFPQKKICLKRNLSSVPNTQLTM